MTRLVAYNRNPNIGVMGRANDKTAIIPAWCPPNFAKAVSEALKVDVVKTNICGTFLTGTMAVMNNKGLLLPKHAMSDEIKKLRELDMNVGIVEDKFTALGNLILSNDSGAIVAPEFSSKSIEIIQDTLDCEISQGKIAGYRTVGSVGIATNKGALVHPLASEEELKWVGEILKVNVDVGTVNRGIGFVRTGVMANTKNALVGDKTTGPEITRIEDALGLL